MAALYRAEVDWERVLFDIASRGSHGKSRSEERVNNSL
jgi:hypothetical protein